MEETKLSERIEFLHTMGLDRRYDDVLLLEDADEEMHADVSAMKASGPAFDYQAQVWMDHADYDLPLLFCGSDRTTCVGIERTAVAS